MKSTQNLPAKALMAAALATTLLALPASAALVINPKELGGYVDFGQTHKNDEKEALTRTSAYLTVSGVHNDHVEVRATLGGLFWYAFPELTSASRVVRFGPGVGQAQAIYYFGDEGRLNPTAKLQFGLFPVKYSQSVNLGEYLYRSGTYPGYLTTGGWSYINASSFLMQGARFTLPTFDGKLTHEFTLHMERDVAQPLHDFTPGYMITGKPTPALEFGAGVVWSNALTFNSKRLAPKVVNNAYSKSTGKPIKGLSDFNITACGTPGQEAFCFEDVAYADTAEARATLAAWNDCQTNGNCSDIGYYTFRGFKTMARASVDLGTLISNATFAPGTFKAYTEVALLGVQDQPFYYEHKSERMPVMLGLNIPTFGFLDRLAVETEYHKSRFQNSFAFPFDNRGAIPIPLGSQNSESPYLYTDEMAEANKTAYAEDDWKWTVYASRTLTPGVTITGQVASDHIRPFSNVANPPSEPFTRTPSDWYYVLRLSFGI